MNPLEGECVDRFDALIAPINQALKAEASPALSASVLTERAELLGFPRPGRRSANGSCRLVAASDGWVALNLARPEDFDLLPALLETEFQEDPWTQEIEQRIRTRRARDLVERGALLGLPLSCLGEAADVPASRRRPLGIRGPQAQTPLVVDLSALWAGPLCSHLLLQLGAKVAKVESLHRPHRPSGRSAAFRQRLDAGKAVHTFDFRRPDGLGALKALLARADIVIEASRPRALAQLGVRAEDFLKVRPGLIWTRLTCYGEAAPMRVGFGDDAAAAGGLVAWDTEGAPAFVGDAIADPLAGLAATRAILQARADGGGLLLDVALAGAAAEIAGWSSQARPHQHRAERTDLVVRSIPGQRRGRR
jgi:crotonobetainyl-CoA:carnitine CoA-transferase CaiB-like acyl-CoA transferase